LSVRGLSRVECVGCAVKDVSIDGVVVVVEDEPIVENAQSIATLPATSASSSSSSTTTNKKKKKKKHESKRKEMVDDEGHVVAVVAKDTSNTKTKKKKHKTDASSNAVLNVLLGAHKVGAWDDDD
jgi:ribosomal protein L12E/L44/L45/RPP1/RPP2